MASRSGIKVIPLKTKNTEKPEFAGDYILDKVLLSNHVGFKVDVKNIMTELNIYESIYKSAITGTLVLTDATNQIARMSVQGLERISFYLKTPGVIYGKEDVIDASEETGEPFHVYKISDRKQITPGIISYTLHFASREFMRNLRTKVSHAYDGKYDQAVRDIMSDKEYLDSRKKLHYESTGNQNKIVIPNLSPFDAINYIARRSIPEKSKGAGYYFYETTKGYYFRSWESMITESGTFARPQRQDFDYQPLKMENESNATKQSKIERGFESVDEYQFTNNFHDVAANTLLGTYGHRVISHNLFDKSYNVSDYNFHNEYRKTPHTDTIEPNAGNMFPIMDTPVDYDNSDNLSDYSESRVSLQPTSPFLHNKDVGMYGLDVVQDGPTTGQSISQYNQVINGTELKLTVKGQSQLQAGDLIRFHMKDVNADNRENGNPTDPRFSGNYIITKVRHTVTADTYKMILQCVKDSVATAYGDIAPNPHLNVHETSKTSTHFEEIDGDINY